MLTDPIDVLPRRLVLAAKPMPADVAAKDWNCHCVRPETETETYSHAL